MARVYIETTIRSFLAARPSRDVVIAGKQETTRIWWELRAPRFELFVSPFVWDQAALGDPEVARRRCELLTGLHVLAVDEETTRITDALLASGAIPAQAATDASHIAVAIRHGMDFLLTWNCAHIANAQSMPTLRAVAASLGYDLPTICTPDELMEDPND
ncbi:MAG: type II toxin-antitoxin system VapC family toxin [Verrucomicrobia bacterium]|nr:type II toxin-antitoxin system VapC family toxin [Verrucomicrobiota bacterium]